MNNFKTSAQKFCDKIAFLKKAVFSIQIFFNFSSRRTDTEENNYNLG